jgi:hypothetical protein
MSYPMISQIQSAATMRTTVLVKNPLDHLRL